MMKRQSKDPIANLIAFVFSEDRKKTPIPPALTERLFQKIRDTFETSKKVTHTRTKQGDKNHD
jgi:hypothetical protein